MGSTDAAVFKFAALSAVKHEYVPLGVAAHPRFEPVVVAEDADQGEWAHERNLQLAQDLGVPYIRDIEKAISDYGAQVAVISSQAERHCDLAVSLGGRGPPRHPGQADVHERGRMRPGSGGGGSATA